MKLIAFHLFRAWQSCLLFGSNFARLVLGFTITPTHMLMIRQVRFGFKMADLVQDVACCILKFLTFLPNEQDVTIQVGNQMVFEATIPLNSIRNESRKNLTRDFQGISFVWRTEKAKKAIKAKNTKKAKKANERRACQRSYDFS